MRICVIVLLFQMGFALIAYDCSQKAVKITAISLSSVEACPTPIEDPKERKTSVQLVTRKKFSLTSFFSCLVERTYLVQYCGMGSHTAAQRQGLRAGEILAVSREACQGAIVSGFYTTPSGYQISDIKVNSTGVFTMTEKGQLVGSRCNGESFSVGGEAFEQSIMQSSYKITIRVGRFTIDEITGEAIMSSGYRANFHDGAFFDPDNGYVFWNTQERVGECSQTSYAVVYQGPAAVFTSVGGGDVLVVNYTDQTMAVGLKGPTLVCAQQALTTDHTNLFLIEERAGLGFYFKQEAITSLEVDPFLYTNSKIVFLEKHLALNIRALFRHLNMRICAVERQALTNTLSLAFIAPDEFAFAYTKEPGMTAAIKGEVVYVMKCLQVPVNLRDHGGRCYQELPVTYNETDMFMKPRTRLLVQYGTEVECNPIAPVMFKIESQWMRMHPHPVHAPSPIELTAAPQEIWTYNEPHNLMKSGIYSEATLADYQKRLLFPAERTAITNIVSRRLVGENSDMQGLDGMKLISEKSFKKAQTSFMHQVYGWYWNITTHIASFLGLLALLMLIKSIIDCGINGTLLYKTFGWSVKLLAALWGTVAKHLLILANSVDPVKQGYQPAEAPVKDECPPEEEVEMKEIEVTKIYPSLHKAQVPNKFLT